MKQDLINKLIEMKFILAKKQDKNYIVYEKNISYFCDLKIFINDTNFIIMLFDKETKKVVETSSDILLVYYKLHIDDIKNFIKYFERIF